MTVTYVGDLSTDLDKIRFHIQDTTSGSGPKPNGGNFTDDELAALQDIEGTWQLAVAAAFETLSALWAKYANVVTPSGGAPGDISERYLELARMWRARHGAARKVYTAGVVKQDGYSDDIASGDVTANEYTVTWRCPTIR